MAKELVISAGRHETRVAITEDDQLVEIYFQRANEYSLAGSIHKGRVTRVLPGMQSAFVDLGLERDTFLYVSDFFEENEEFEKMGDTREAGRSERTERGDRGGERGGRGRGERGGRGRGERGRDRDGDRESGREALRGERRSTPQLLNVAAVNPEVEEDELIGAEVQPQEQSPVIAAASESQDVRRGNRRRRRGRGGRGSNLPESKFSDAITEEDEADEAEEVVVDSVQAIEEDDSALPILLPGESLSKYARVRAVEPEELEEDGEEEEVPAQEAAVSTVGAPTPEAVAAQQEEAVLAEVKEHLAEIAREDEEMRDFEEAERLAYEEKEAKEDAHGDSPERIEVHVSAAPVETLEVEDEDEGDDAEPSTPKESGVEEGAFEEVVAAEGASEDAAEAESGVLPAMGYSAHLRQADQRFLQQRSPQDGGDRGGRRRRRGGRGRDRAMVAGDPSVEVSDDSADTADEALSESLVTEASATEGLNAEAGAATAVEALPNESRRERRGGRDRGERGDRGERHGNRSERTERTERHERSERGERRAQPSITELLKEGQEVLVQIAKEPLGQKGARITSHIALPGRYCVYMPTVDHTGVSRKIGTDEERSRLKKILLAHSEGIPGGFIIRTAGEGRTEDEIKADIEFLHNLWMDIRKKAEAKKAPALIYHDLEIVERVLRDQLGPEFKSIWVDNEEIYESILRFLERFQPQMVSRVKMYTRQVSIFDSFGITQELEKALRPKVWLKSGGYIVINQTEALVAIDINTGKFVGRSNKLEDTIVKTNIEAIKEIVRQIRLRDLGGIIVIDFIDMDERKNRMRVMQALEEAMRADRAPYKILQFNDFGLVAITRKRVKQSLERTLCAPCPYCEGSGYVKSVQTVVTEIVNEAKKLAKALEDSKDVLLRVNPEVAKVFKSAENQYLEELEEILGRPVMVVSDALIHQEKFDLA